MLKTHIAAVLEDRQQSLSLRVRVWVSSLAELFSATKHVRGVKFGQLSEAFFLLLNWDVLRPVNLSNQRVAKLNIDLNSFDLAILHVSGFTSDEPLVD